MPFSQSPIEASIWTAFVGLQEWIASSILATGLFKAAVAMWIGFLFIRAIYQMMLSRAPAAAFGRFGIILGYSALGLTLLRSQGSSDFRPVDARGAAWAESSKALASGKHEALRGSTRGLAFYVMIHRGAAGLSDFISSRVGQLFKDQAQSQSPYLLLQTMAETSGATIDDPSVVTGLDWLFQNCTDRKTPVLSPTSSYSALFDLGRDDCKRRYAALRQDLTAWASSRWGTSIWNVGEIKLAQLRAKFGGIDETTLQNKMIASALVNMARSRMGQNADNSHARALLSKDDSVFGSSSAFFTSLNNTFSTSGVANGLLHRLTGTDFIAADQRNQSAVLYNKIVQFIPPIRGYAKGLLALAFVFAAAALCFGTPRFMLGWFGMLAMFTAYEPLSTILYETTMLFTNASETTGALAALRDDPLVLSGAAIVDDNLARIQAVYFSLQLGLATVCGAGGISLFVFTRRLGSGLTDGMITKISHMAGTAARLSR